MTLLLVVHVLSVVRPTVLEREHAISVHHVVCPFAGVFTTIGPDVDALTLHAVLLELSLKHASILPGETTRTMLFVVRVLALVDGAVGPCLLA